MIKNVVDTFIEKLRTIPQIKYTAEDLGQLENPLLFSDLQFPCALVEIEKIEYTDRSNRVQNGTGSFGIRVIQKEGPDTNEQTHELARQVYTALQGLGGDTFSGTSRTKLQKYNHGFRYREINQTFRFQHTDESAANQTFIAVVPPEITIG